MKSHSALTLMVAGIALLATALEAPRVSLQEADGWRRIESNGLPDHRTGAFPNRGNPHAISAQRYVFRVTLTPKEAAQPKPAHHASFGVALNGVPFEAGTGEFWKGDRRWNYEAKSGHIDLGLDDNDAHVQPGGQYHYHGLPSGLIQRLGGDPSKRMMLLGWAADGFPIYASHGPRDPMSATSPLVAMRSSYQLKQGTRSAGNEGPGGAYDGTFTADYEYVEGSGDLDACHGRFGVTPEFPQGIYHYFITASFPYLSRQWKGEPDASFQKQGPPNGGPPGGRGRRGGPGFGPPPPGFGPPFRR